MPPCPEANLSGPPRRSLEEVVDAAVANTNPTVLLLIPPLMHGAAIYSLLTAFLMGAPRVLTRSFDPMEVLRLVEAEKITGITVVGDAIARPIADGHHRKRRALRPFDSPTDRVGWRVVLPEPESRTDNPTTGVGDQGCIRCFGIRQRRRRRIR